MINSFPENIEFKPWQLSILEEVEIPTERKMIWVVGKSCGDGKTWLQNYIKYKYGKNVDTLIEGIKDGKLFASKYDSQRITVNTPNILMVFSNDAPNTSRLAKDRWKLFFIENDQLKEHII